MQLTNTTDYAIRIVCYLAIKKRRVTTAKLASELKIPESYIPKITKQLKKEKIISASEGISGGYALAKNPEKISLFDVISCMESTMAISRFSKIPAVFHNLFHIHIFHNILSENHHMFLQFLHHHKSPCYENRYIHNCFPLN